MRSVTRVIARPLAALVPFALAAAACAPGAAVAQADYPNRPIRMIIPYAPGGVADIAARLIGNKLSEAWKQNVVIENRTGGGGTIGADAVAKSPADGYTLLVSTSADFTAYTVLYPKLPYSIERDFAPVIWSSDTPVMIAANANAPFNTLQELVAHAKTLPGGLSYSSPAPGSVNHILAEQLGLAAGIKLVHVAYRGGAPASTAIAAGEVPFGMVAMSSAAPHIKSGKAKGIAVTTATRAKAAPDLPTIAESGFAGVVGSNWSGIAAPAGTPRAIITKLNAEMNRILKLPDVIERFAAVGSEPGGGSPEDFAARIKDETARFAKVIQQTGIKVE